MLGRISLSTRRIALLVTIPALLALVISFAFWYAEDRGIPPEIAAALLPAFLIEAILYVCSGVRTVRERLEELSPAAVAIGMSLVAPLSYFACAIPTGTVGLLPPVILVALALVAAFWYLVFGRGTAADAAFLLLMAAPLLLDMFDLLYPDVAERLPTQTLGVLMWYRTGLLSVLVLRRMEGIGFGFLPRPDEWAIGIRNFIWFFPIGILAAVSVGFVELRDVQWGPRTLLIAVATFAGVLWVLAVAEEFFFRGLLQQMLTRALGSPVAGLLLASLLFGAAHLGYRAFPNWRFAVLAAVAGVFYGRAYQQAGSIRAAMVTHAFVVTVWKTFLM
jgi:membrane protease YdiL (CAAX protease family)